MKQLSVSTQFIFTAILLVILCTGGLYLCITWNIGGYTPLTIVACTLGTLLLMAYTTKRDHEDAQFDLLLKAAYKAEAEAAHKRWLKHLDTIYDEEFFAEAN